VVYEDENILLADKKPGVLCHSAGAWDYNTLIANIQAYLAQKGEWRPREENSFAPALCNRIDRNTGGIVIAAKNAEALRILNEKIRAGPPKAPGKLDRKKISTISGAVHRRDPKPARPPKGSFRWWSAELLTGAPTRYAFPDGGRGHGRCWATASTAS
jgi:hypothetical protein